jgi:hypothetical protein
MSENIPRRQFATALGGMMAGIGGLSAAAQGTTTQAQIDSHSCGLSQHAAISHVGSLRVIRKNPPLL